MLSLADQSGLLRARFPSFRVISLTNDLAIWEGAVQLRPKGTQYRLKIEYALPKLLAVRNPTDTWYPRVFVLSPNLQVRPGNPAGLLPHVWWPHSGPPHLCLFKADLADWSYSDAIADTTVPDACEWLFFYEAWLVTGRWCGGGVPHNQPERELTSDFRSQIRRHASDRTYEIAMAP